MLIKPYIPNLKDRSNKKDYREARNRDKEISNSYKKKERYRGRDLQKRKRDDSTSGGEDDRRTPTPEVELTDRDKLSK